MALVRQIKKVQVKTPEPTRPDLPLKTGNNTGYFTSDNVNDLKNLPGLSSAEIVNLTINNIEQKIQNTFNTPSGQDHEVQFKNSAQFDGDQGLKYNVQSQTLTAENLCVPGTSDLNDVSCLRIRSGNPGYVLTKLDYCGNVTWCDPCNFLANPLCIGTINCCNIYTNISCNTTKIAFDQDSGFAVSDIGEGTAKIAINVGVTCVNNLSGAITLSAGNNISIGASGNTLTFCSIDSTTPATPTSLGSTYAYNQTSYCNTFVGYNAGNIGNTGTSNIAIGQNALINNTTGNNNIAIGNNALRSQTSNLYDSSNIAIGKDAMYSNVTNYGNVAIGERAMYCSSGEYQWGNVAIGWEALKRNISGGTNVAIGYGSMSGGYGFSGPNSYISSNTGVGTRTLRNITTGCGNVAVGHDAMFYMKNGCHNVAIGTGAIQSATYGNKNIGIGYLALRTVDNGNDNISLGWMPSFNTTSGSHNFSAGCFSLFANTTGNCNIALGTKSLYGNVGSNNISIGAYSGCDITTGNDNTIIGQLAGAPGLTCTLLIGAGTCERIKVDNTGLNINNSAKIITDSYNNISLGYANLVGSTTGAWNIAIGTFALYTNSLGECNVAIGGQALQNNTTGWRNVAIGKNAALYNTFGGENTAIGYNSLLSNTSGCRNFAIGAFSLYGMNGGNDNIGIGIGALRNTSSGCYNVAIGIHAGCCNRGSRSTFIGNNAGASVLTGNSNTIIGNLYGSAGLQCTVLIGAGTCERIKVDNTGFYVNGTCWCSGGATVSAATPTSLGTVFGFTSSNGNTYVGYNGGSAVTTGLNNTIIGSLTGSAGLTCTVLIGAGTCERIKVDNSGLCVNGALFPNSLYDTFTNLTGATGVVVHNFALGPIFRHTSVASNFTVNVTNLNLNSGSVTNITLLIIQGATAYIPNAIQIAGVAQTLNWSNGTTPTGNANKVDLFNFSMLNNSGTYLVIGQSATFG